MTPSRPGEDDITRELEALASAGAVDDELAALKRSLGQLEPGSAHPADAPAAGR